jgi:hypothetical protein
MPPSFRKLLGHFIPFNWKNMGNGEIIHLIYIYIIPFNWDELIERDFLDAAFVHNPLPGKHELVSSWFIYFYLPLSPQRSDSTQFFQRTQETRSLVQIDHTMLPRSSNHVHLNSKA